MLAQFSQNQKAIEIDGAIIRQDQFGRYCLNDLHKASGGEQKNQPRYFLENKQTQDLIQELTTSGIPLLPVEVINGGNNRGTYVVKQIVYAYAMWISAAFSLKVINTFDAVVTGSVQPTELSRMEILQIAMESEKENIALRGELAVAAPKAQALDTIANTEGTYTIRECAKTIGIGERKLVQMLLDKKWVFRENDGRLQPYAEKTTAGIFINRPSPVITNKNTGEERVHLHMRITAYGLTRITGLVNKFKGVAA